MTRRSFLQALAAAAAAGLASGGRAEDTEVISPQVQSAVDRGIEWLAKQQDRNGSWHPASMASNTSAITGLAVLAFMARGHVPGQGPYGDVLNRGIDAILSNQTPDGILAAAALGNTMYDHGICCIALCEVYGMLDDRRQGLARSAIAKAIRATLEAQAIVKSPDMQGGWRYTPKAHDSDTSVTGWQLMALRGAKNAGAYVPASAIDDGIAYIKRRAVRNGGFSYEGASNIDMAMTGTGILTLTLLGMGDSPEVKAAGDWLLTRNIETEPHYYYAVYYCSQAAYQLGGVYWDTLRVTITNSLLGKQSAGGSWRTASGGDSQGGDSYCTAMAILGLTVPYRYLPIYQK